MGRGLVKVLFGVVIGILVVVLGLGVGAYVLLTMGGTMGKIEESSVGETLSIHFNDEQKEMSLLQYGTALFGILGDLSNAEIGTIEDAIGSTFLSEKLSDAIGLEPAVLRTATLTTLGETIANGLTVEVMQTKFGIEFPDSIPLFQDQHFLSQPVSKAFGDIDDYTMDKFIVIVYTEDATLTNPASSGLMQKLGKKTLGTISTDMDGVIQDTTIGEVIEVNDETASPVMKYLKDWKIGELDKAEMLDEYNNPIPGTGGAIQNMKISDAVAINEDSAPVLQYFLREETKLNNIDSAIKNMTIGDAVKIDETSSKVLQYLKTSKLDELNASINAMKISDAVEITEESHAVLKAISDFTLNDIGDKDKLQNEAINPIKLGEIIAISSDAEPILLALQDTELGQLQAKVAILTIKDVFKDFDAGILSLVPETTLVNQIAATLPSKVTTTSLYALHCLGIINLTIDTGVNEAACTKKVKTYNADINSVVSYVNGNLAAMNANNVTVTAAELVSTYGATLTGGYYVLTPAVVRALSTVNDGGVDVVRDGTVISVSGDNVKIKIAQGPEDDDNYNVFSLQNVGVNCEIAFESDLNMISEKGGYAYFNAPSVTGVVAGSAIFNTKMVRATTATPDKVPNVLIETVNYTPVVLP